MNLVVGATGVLGSEICRQLAGKGMPVRAAVRPTSNPERVEELRALGAELIEADLKEPASLSAACRGVDAVLSTATTTASRQPGDTIAAVDSDGQCRLVDAARANGVRHFVYVSYSADIDGADPSPLTVAKRTVERHVQESGLSYTILRPNIFMDVWLSPMLGFDYPNARAQVFGDGNARLSWIAVRDVAQFATASLVGPWAWNAALELGGPEALSPNEVIQVFELASGRRFQVSYIPVEALQGQRAAATDPLDESFAALALATAEGSVTEMSRLLEVSRLELMTVRDYAQAVLAAEAVSPGLTSTDGAE